MGVDVVDNFVDGAALGGAIQGAKVIGAAQLHTSEAYTAVHASLVSRQLLVAAASCENLPAELVGEATARADLDEFLEISRESRS